MKKILYLILLLNFQLAQSQFIPSQSTTETEVSLKSLQLPNSWWSEVFFNQKKNIFEQRKTAYLEQLEKIIVTFPKEKELRTQFNFINELFGKYSERYYALNNDVDTTTNFNEIITDIDKLLELNSQKRTVNSKIENLNYSKKRFEDSIKMRSKFIDLIKIKYTNINLADEDKLFLELDWVQAKLTFQLESMSLKEQKKLITKENLVLKKINALVVQSVPRINFKTPNVSELNELNAKLENIIKLVDEKNFSINKTQSLNTPNSFTYQNEYFEWVNLSIQKDFVELNVIKQHSINLLEKNNSNLDDLTTNLNNDEEVITRIKNEIDSWSERIDSYLIRPPLSDQNETDQKLERKTQILAQKAKIDLSALVAKLDDAKLIQQIINVRVLKKVGTGKKFINYVFNTASNIWHSASDLIQQPLFSIGEQPITLLPLIKLILIILLGYFVSKIISIIIHRYEEKRNIVNNSSIYLLHRLIHYLIIFIATMAGFKTLGLNLGNLTLIAGALSVGIGFGLQNIVSNFVAGITIMVEKTLSVGDFIELESGTTGTVMAINARSTHINTNDNIDLIIPNAELVTNIVTNWTLKETLCRIKIPFGVAYGSDKELVKKAALEAANSVIYTQKNVKGKEPEVWMTGFGDSSVDYWLLIWVSDFGATRPNRMRAYYLWELETQLNKYNIKIPFPQRDVHMIKNNEETDLTGGDNIK